MDGSFECGLLFMVLISVNLFKPSFPVDFENFVGNSFPLVYVIAVSIERLELQV